MLRNYLKIAWRNILKQKVFSIINIIGLTIGLSAAFVIGLMIYYDTTFDNFHKDGDRISRVVTDLKSAEDTWKIPGVNWPMEDAIKDNSNFETVSGFYTQRPAKVENREADIELKCPISLFIQTLNTLISLSMNMSQGIGGSPIKAKSGHFNRNEGCGILCKNSASEVIGKTLVYNDSINVTVTGVVKNFEARTDIVFRNLF